MRSDTVEILAALSDMSLKGKIGSNFTAYREGRNIILEIPEEPINVIQTTLIIYEFGNLMEKLIGEKGFKSRWIRRFQLYCENLLDSEKGENANAILPRKITMKK